MPSPSPAPATDVDVLILGGGLAGLTLAMQLRLQQPDRSVAVLERRPHPVREAAHKVGESTVEIGAHYFAEVLGLRRHLETAQVRKYGLRYFFSDGMAQVHACSEMGVSRLLPTPSWQLDRGRFENHLGERALALGADFRHGAVVRGIELADDGGAHAVAFEHEGAQHVLRARWVVDAAGRAGLLKRKLGLAEANDHDANAAWWRVDGHIDVDAWTGEGNWPDRFQPAERWKSTNHLCGPGYWFWLIPLASDSHSLGIVCDAKMHPLETMNTHAKAMDWLRRHQPRAARALEDPRHKVQDFLFLRHFSHGCRQVFSGRRWALMHELRGAPEPTLADQLARLSPCDIVLVEGFKHEPIPKLEVFRPSLGHPALHPQDPCIVAVASDESLPIALPVLGLNHHAAIADFILGYLDDHDQTSLAAI